MLKSNNALRVLLSVVWYGYPGCILC